jgi:hypothetical protein
MYTISKSIFEREAASIRQAHVHQGCPGQQPIRSPQSRNPFRACVREGERSHLPCTGDGLKMRAIAKQTLIRCHDIGFAEEIGVDQLLLLAFRHAIEFERSHDLRADFIELIRGEMEPGVRLMER